MKRTILPVLALAGALALAGCGSTTTPASPSSGSSGATSSATPAAAQSAAPTAKVGDTVDLAQVTARASAAMKKARTGHAVMAMGSQGSLEMDMDLVSNSSSVDIDSPQGAMTVRKIGTVLYLGGMPGMPPGKKWVKVDTASDDPMAKQLAPMLDSLNNLSEPGAMMSADGVKATVIAAEGGTVTYKTTMTMAQLQEMSRKAMEKMSSGSPVPTPSTSASGDMVMTQTFDAAGLPTRVTVVTTQNGAKETMKVTYSKWGEPVSIQAPPASQIGTIPMPTG